MADTLSERILAALAAEIATIDGVVGVYRSRADGFARRESPSVVVEPGDQQPREISTCRTLWADQVLIGIYTCGDVPDQLADPIRRDIHAKVMSFRDELASITIVDLQPETVTRELEAGDKPAMWTLCPYRVSYQTAVDDLTIEGP
jgi:hypothetical protein